MNRKWIRPSSIAFTLGAAIMVLIVHPAIEGLHLWRSGMVEVREGPLALTVQAVKRILQPEMTTMTIWMALIGGILGVGVVALQRRTRSSARPQVAWSETSLRDLIAKGEGERLEFKSSLRWDLKHVRSNKALEVVIAKSICGLMNHRGGTLLIGIDDDGHAIGIESDYSTLNHQNWDGFERCLTSIVSGKLGTRHCSRIHSHLVLVEQLSIAVIVVEAADQPVYCKDGNTDRYFVRTGNSTRELNVREAIAHISVRRKKA